MIYLCIDKLYNQLSRFQILCKANTYGCPSDYDILTMTVYALMMASIKNIHMYIILCSWMEPGKCRWSTNEDKFCNNITWIRHGSKVISVQISTTCLGRRPAILAIHWFHWEVYMWSYTAYFIKMQAVCCVFLFSYMLCWIWFCLFVWYSSVDLRELFTHNP